MAFKFKGNFNVHKAKNLWVRPRHFRNRFPLIFQFVPSWSLCPQLQLRHFDCFCVLNVDALNVSNSLLIVCIALHFCGIATVTILGFGAFPTCRKRLRKGKSLRIPSTRVYTNVRVCALDTPGWSKRYEHFHGNNDFEFDVTTRMLTRKGENLWIQL